MTFDRQAHLIVLSCLTTWFYPTLGFFLIGCANHLASSIIDTINVNAEMKIIKISYVVIVSPPFGSVGSTLVLDELAL